MSPPDGATHARRVDIRLLGPLEAFVDGRPAAIGGQRPRALLAVLALSAGTGVSTDRLIDTVWDGSPPAGAANAVQVYVSRLRKALQPVDADAILRSVPGGYLLAVPRESIDVLRFEQLAASGHDALGVGDAGAAAQLLGAALALWRGPALEDLAGTGTGPLVTRLEARRLATQLDLVDAEIAQGQHARVIPELEELAGQHPLDEGLVRRLMTALYLSGRQADALAAYSSAAARLAEELGVDPGPELRQTQGLVLRQQLTAPGRPQTSPGQPDPDGPARRAAAGDAAASATAVAAGGRDARTRELELLLRPRGNLIGREPELAQVLAALADPSVRLVSLLGPGGMGKTRLALAVAAALTARAADDLDTAEPHDTAAPRTVVVPLSMVTDVGELLVSICQAIGADPEHARDPGAGLLGDVVRSLTGRPTVLILDNLEQLVDAPGTLEDILALLDQLPELTLLCTSRVALRLGVERQVVLSPLSLPETGDESVEAVLRSHAVQLFVQRAAAVQPDFAVTDDNVEAIAEICRLLDGLPLALELAAARTRMLPPTEMVRRTGRLLHLLTGGGRDLPERQRSLRAALDWSAQLLDDVEIRVFAQLSVFSAGWTLDAADAVCDSTEPVIEVLARLIDRSLVVAEPSGRFSLLEAVQEYAGERLAGLAGPDEPAGGVLDAARDRHARFYSGLADELGLRFHASPSAATRAALDVESGNFAAALERTVETGDGLLLGTMVFGLQAYWYFTGRIAQSERWLAIAGRVDLPHDVRVRLLLSAGNVAFVRGELASAMTMLTDALAAARELGDELQLTRSLRANSVVCRHAGRLDAALDFIDEGLAHVRGALLDAGPSEVLDGMASALANERGEILDGLGRRDEARAYFESYRAQAIALDDHTNLAWALANLAMNDGEQGRTDAAREYAEAALVAADAGDSTPAQGDVRAVAAMIELSRPQGDPRRAVILLADAIRLLHSSGQLITLPDTVSLLGAALLRAGHTSDAARMLAAGHAWRAGRGLAVVGLLAESTIARAHDELNALAPSQLVKLESGRGAAVPFGWIDALGLPEVLDLRDDQARVLRLVDHPSDPDIQRRGSAASTS